MINGFSSAAITQSEYARRTKDLISLITDLRGLGAQAHFDLPRIAVIGNTSVGKSSLVEALSGGYVSVPRAVNCCTRSPMECRITRSDSPWQCQIIIRWENDADGNKITSREELFGPVLHDRSELEEMIRRAQLAVLNPSVPVQYLVDLDTSTLDDDKNFELPASLGSKRQFQFSESVVCLNLSGPDLTDLAFIDLPGLISNVGPGDDPSNIDAVKNMVMKHIEGNTLILLTITMRDDIDNQGAARLAQEADINGDRTIGALTKPDTIQAFEEKGWIRILEGLSRPLKYGYYMTKQPNPEELKSGISYEAARMNEEEFFRTTPPWCDMANHRDRMGTPQLTKALSKLLGMVINRALPELRRNLKDSLQDVRNQLATLPPPPPDDSASELLKLVTGFSADVGWLVEGAQGSEQLLRQCRPAYKQFKRDIRRTAPRFVPFTATEGKKGCVELMLEPEEPIESEQAAEDKTLEMNLDAVGEHIEGSVTRELPYNVPFKAKIALIEKFLVNWGTHSTACFDIVHSAAAAALKDLARAHFSRYGTTLPDNVEAIVESVVEQCHARTAERLQWMLELEDPPFTNNDHYFSIYRERYLTKYRDARKDIRDDGMQKANLDEAIAALAGLGWHGLVAEDLGRLSGPDPHEQELTVMAETAAYFHVAYKRIIDNVPRIIDHDFLRAISREMQGALVVGLRLGDDNASARAKAYLSEDENVAVTRAQLVDKRLLLEGVQTRMRVFGM